MCSHLVCKKIRNRGGKGGVANMVHIWKKPDVVVLPKERAGPNKGRFTLFGGGREPEDRGCFLRTGFRELIQETSLLTKAEWDALSEEEYWLLFKRLYRSENEVKWYMLNKTPVLVVQLPRKVGAEVLNVRIRRALRSKVPWCWREISSCREFKVTEVIKGGTGISAYAKIGTVLYCTKII